jgi:hypothetical protein
MRFVILAAVLVVGCSSHRLQTKPFILARGERLFGNVLDPAGALVPNVEVELWQGGVRVATSRTGNNDGAYTFDKIPSAAQNYILRTKAPEPWCKPGLAPPSQQGARDIRLQLCGSTVIGY